MGEARDRSVEVAVNGRTLAVVRGDITRVPADAIVNAANEHLVGGGGVDGAIHRAGGPAIMRELEETYGRDRRCATGKAVVTGGGDLPAKWVIHAVGPRWSGGQRGEADLLRAAYVSALSEAASVGARSVTFPAISCGIYGYPLDQGAAIALDAVRNHLGRGDSSVERATFVLFSEDTLGEFSNQLKRLSSG